MSPSEVRPFGDHLAATIEDRGHVCLGIDPHAFLLDAWGLPDTADGVREFGLRTIDAAAAVVGIVKPQVAFFERHGSQGFAALEDVLEAARAAGLLIIADAKRGDVGSTVAAYGAAWLTPGSPLEADALTVSAYQGVGSLSDVIALAVDAGKGLFVLAATSNPESWETQTAIRSHGQDTGRSVAGGIVAEVDRINSGSEGWGSVGVVLGATIRLADFGIDARTLASTPILAPGFGEQGALLQDARALFGDNADRLVANVGRSVLRAGPDGLVAALTDAVSELEIGLSR